MAHRYAWTQVHGPIPPGLVICHQCDNPACYELDHLFLGTVADNNRDMAAKGRSRTRMKLTEDQVRDVFRRRRAGERSDALASEFGIDRTHVNAIARGVFWRRLDLLGEAS